MNQEPKNLQARCILCARETNHEIVGEYATENLLKEGDIHYGATHQVIRCMGCNDVSFRRELWVGNDKREVELYPNRQAQRPALGSVLLHAPEKVQRIYIETVSAFAAEAHVLTAAGMRAVVEAVCQDQGCSGPNLKVRIEELVAKGVLAASQAEFLHLHRVLGNEALHETEAPPVNELAAALEIVESLLKNVYELPFFAKMVTYSRDQRLAGKP